MSQIERHYTNAEVATLLQVSVEKSRQLIMNEPGVLVISHKPEGKDRAGKRCTRKMYRIPESVLQRILRRCANPAA